MSPSWETARLHLPSLRGRFALRSLASLLLLLWLWHGVARGLDPCTLFGDTDPTACDPTPDASDDVVGREPTTNHIPYVWGSPEQAVPAECGSDRALRAFANMIAMAAKYRREPDDVTASDPVRWRAATTLADGSRGFDWAPVTEADARQFGSPAGSSCGVDRVPAANLSPERFAADYEDRRRPVIVVGLDAVDSPDAADTVAVRNVFRRAVLLYCFGHARIDVRPTLYPEPGQAAAHHFAVPFGRYVTRLMTKRELGDRNSDARYVFADFDRRMAPEWQLALRVHAGPRRLLRPPPVLSATGAAHARENVGPDTDLHLALGVGAANTGVPFHTHAAVWAHQIYGTKRWLLAPPGPRPPNATRERTSIEWATTVLPNLPHNRFTTDDLVGTVDGDGADPAGGRQESASVGGNDGSDGRHAPGRVLDCEVAAGEALYLPSDWHHSTVNLGDTVVLSTFHTSVRDDCPVPWIRPDAI